MGSYTQYITNEGENLIAQALSGGILTFTQVVTSASLVVGTEDEIRLITDIAGVQQTTAPSAAVRTGDNTIRVSATFENTGVEKSYAVQTVGLYAKVGEEPQKLFAIAQAQKPSEMPDENKTSYASVIFNFNITVQNAKEIEITVTPGGALPSDVFYSMFPGLNPPTTEDAGKLVQINEKGKWEYGIADAVLSAKSENPIQNKVVNDAIEKLNKAVEDANQAIANAMELRASLTDYGMTKVTNSAAVTDSTGLALAATEKNALIPGTLAQQIAQLNTDLIYSLKDYPDLGENYIMKASDFTRPGLYHIASLSEADEKNYLHPYNVGYYHVICVSDNYQWQVLLLFSPRLFFDNKMHFYIGFFANGEFMGWSLFSSGTYN